MTPILGCDYAAGRPDPAALYAVGIRFACRYLSYSAWKNLTKPEADRLLSAGVAIVSNWETSETAMKNGYDYGVRHARDAQKQHLACGGDPKAPVYFSYDTDPNVGSLSPVLAYLDGAASVLGLERVGIYGGYKIIKDALDGDHARWAWQTVAWSHGVWDPRAHIRQMAGAWTVDGVSLDRNLAQFENYGQWDAPTFTSAPGTSLPPIVIPVPTPVPTPAPVPAPSEEDDLPLYFRQGGDVYAMMDNGGWRPASGPEVYGMAHKKLEDLYEPTPAELDAMFAKITHE